MASGTSPPISSECFAREKCSPLFVDRCRWKRKRLAGAVVRAGKTELEPGILIQPERYLLDAIQAFGVHDRQLVRIGWACAIRPSKILIAAVGEGHIDIEVLIIR